MASSKPQSKSPPRQARRGRPPNSDGQETATRLLDAAASACAEHGFDGATMSEIAKRAGVTAAAIYNHFDSREDLLYAAGVRSLRRVTDVVPQGLDASASARAIATEYVRPGLKETRRLLAELHLAGGRDPRLSRLLATWHKTWADALIRVLPPDDPAPEATVKALFLLLLGLCHIEDLRAVKASPDDVAERIEHLVDALVPPGRQRPGPGVPAPRGNGKVKARR
jgi:AcrR family transcriptional regulator